MVTSFNSFFIYFFNDPIHYTFLSVSSPQRHDPRPDEPAALAVSSRFATSCRRHRVCRWPLTTTPTRRRTASSGSAAVRKYDSLILLTLGTGVGGGIIVNDLSIEGINSFGAECGHIIVDSRPDARLCVWGGGRGELEAYASASAVAQPRQEAARRGAYQFVDRGARRRAKS